METYEQTFPYLTESILHNKLAPKIETINAGVSGYSPWQEYIYLSKEGIKYDPDLIVVSFVLNDVTEKFGLIKFGGTGQGVQLSLTASSKIDRFFSQSGLLYMTRKINARIRFGSNVQQGAKQAEILDVESLVYQPNSFENQRPWEITLENLGKNFDFGKERDIPVILVVFPFTFQFEDINALSTPQKIVSEHAIEHQVPVIDLLPILSQKMTEQGLTPEDYFLDEDHLSPLGSEVVAEILADFIQENGLALDRSGKIAGD